MTTVPELMKKRCSKCRVYKPATTKHFYITRKKKKDGTFRLDHICIICRRDIGSTSERYTRESDLATMLRKARMRARQRAATKLCQQYPNEYRKLVKQELKALGWDGDEDLRKGANRKRGEGKVAKIQCKDQRECGWVGHRKKANRNPLELLCPWCLNKVEYV